MLKIFSKIHIVYFQELPNYLRGYHKCAGLDITRMAAYIYRAQFGDDMSVLDYLE